MTYTGMRNNAASDILRFQLVFMQGLIPILPPGFQTGSM